MELRDTWRLRHDPTKEEGQGFGVNVFTLRATLRQLLTGMPVDDSSVPGPAYLRNREKEKKLYTAGLAAERVYMNVPMMPAELRAKKTDVTNATSEPPRKLPKMAILLMKMRLFFGKIDPF